MSRRIQYDLIEKGRESSPLIIFLHLVLPSPRPSLVAQATFKLKHDDTLRTNSMAGGEPIELFVYDLSNGMAQSLGPMLVGRPIEGIWHTSIVLFGVEIWFGQGIHAKTPPGTTHHGAPRKRIQMGSTQLDRDTFFEYIEGMRETYKAERYHLLEFNCNHFTNDVIGFLNGKTIPAEILNQPKELMATPFGQQMRPMIESMFVGANNRSAGDAVNNILPALATTTDGSRPTPRSSDVPSGESVTSNLEIVTSVTSLRSTLSRARATAVMFTDSPGCPPCRAIKPHFENLAQLRPRTTFALVETRLGQGREIASMQEFGGPVTATPTFVFFVGTQIVGECKGADKTELDTRIGMLELEAFPPHPHEKLELPHLSKLSKSLAPITFTTFPPLQALSSKLSLATESFATKDASFLTDNVVKYLASLPLPSPPTTSSLSTPLDGSFVDTWIDTTIKALQMKTLDESESHVGGGGGGETRARSVDPSLFVIVDLVRLGLARDSARLTARPEFIAKLPRLVRALVDLVDDDGGPPGGGRGIPDRSLLLTTIKLVSNLFLSSVSTREVLVANTQSTREAARGSDRQGPDDVLLNAVTRLLIRALLDEQDDKMRSAGAGLGWSLVAKVYELRVERGSVDGDQESNGREEEWESELAGALLEALAREEQSFEVVHRLTATLGLLFLRSHHHAALRSLLQVLDAHETLKSKALLAQNAGARDDL
ncbi:hypothetical protein JCM3766R1_003494 [Sporobolomyces carnicolor]